MYHICRTWHKLALHEEIVRTCLQIAHYCSESNLHIVNRMPRCSADWTRCSQDRFLHDTLMLDRCFLVFSWRTLVEVWRTPCLQNPCRGANRTRESWWHETIRLSHHKYPYTGRRHLKSKSCKRIRNLIRAGKAGLETRDDRWRQFQFCVFDFQPWLLSKHPHCSFRASIAASHR